MRLIKCILLVFLCAFCQKETLAQKESASKTGKVSNVSYTSRPEVLERLERVFPIKAEEALKIAKKSLKLIDEPDSHFVTCPDGMLWRIIYEIEKKEVTISRSNGRVYKPVRVLRSDKEEELNENIKNRPALEAKEAAEIAKRRFIEYAKIPLGTGEEALDFHFPVACDMGKEWRVFYLLDLDKLRKETGGRGIPNHLPINFVIEKRTGWIKYFNFIDDVRK